MFFFGLVARRKVLTVLDSSVIKHWNATIKRKFVVNR